MTNATVKTQKTVKSTNTVESLKDLGTSIGKNVVDSFQDLGRGMFDQAFGSFSPSHETQEHVDPNSAENQELNKKPLQREKNLFNYQAHHESTVITEQIKQLIAQIRQEIDYIKKADKALLNEVSDIQKISLESVSEKPGIYHVRFLEIVLRTLRLLREKIGESKTWMQALISKKKKRGSLFATRSKKSGTQYSLSQELSSARSVQ